MERNATRKDGAVHTDNPSHEKAARRTGTVGRAEHDGPDRMVDTQHGGRRPYASVFARQTTEEGNIGKMIGIAVHGIRLRPKQGDRSRRHNGNIQHYTDKRVKENAGALAVLIGRFAPPTPWAGPIACEIVFGLPFHKQEKVLTRGVGRAWADTKPDIDNLTKQVLDTLQACGFFTNDSQVCRLVVTKVRMSVPVTHIRLFKLVQLERGPWFVLNCPT